MSRSVTVNSIASVRQLIQFLDPPGDDFKCPICLEILQEPYLTTCCGNHHLCKVCMEKVKEANGRCPLCKEKPFNGFIDKRFERQLHELKVYCIYRPKGCKWVGNYGKLDHHLSIGRESGECQFVVIECPLSEECKEHFLRKNLLNHKENLCKYRQVQCMYCGFASTYQKVAILHPNKCAKYPLVCPNKCSGQTYPRDQLHTHLALCPEEEVDCTFSEMGCKEKVKRQDLQEHLTANLLQHQMVMCQAFREMKKEKQEIEEQLDSLTRREKELELKMIKLSNHEDNQMKTLKFLAKTDIQMQLTYFSKMEEFSNLHPVAPLVLKASFEIKKSFHSSMHMAMGSRSSGNHYTAKPYHSQLFYSHQNGYKLQLSAEIICHCSDCGQLQPQKKVAMQHQLNCRYDEWMQGDQYYMEHQLYNSDMSDYVESYASGYASLAVNLYILKGNNDSQLKWPFQEGITVTIYQQNEHGYRRPVANDDDIFVTGVEQVYIPHETAIFEGNRNHTTTGRKLNIKSLMKKNKASLMQSLKPASHVKQPTNMWQHQSSARDEYLQLQKDEKKTQQEKLRLYKEKGLLFTLDSQRNQGSQYGFWDSSQLFGETVYCEVTFSPQSLS